MCLCGRPWRLWRRGYRCPDALCLKSRVPTAGQALVAAGSLLDDARPPRSVRRSSLQSHPGLDSFLWWLESTLVRFALLSAPFALWRVDLPSPASLRCWLTNLCIGRPPWSLRILLLQGGLQRGGIVKPYKSFNQRCVTWLNWHSPEF